MNENLEEKNLSISETPLPVSPLLKYVGIIILASGAFLILQSLMMVTMSDNTLLALVKATAKAQRDGPNPPYQFKGKSDEAINRIVENAKNRVIKGKQKNMLKFLFIKLIMAILLIITGLGIFSKIKLKEKGTRRFALFSGLILLLGNLVGFTKLGETLKTYGYLEGHSFIKMMDYLWMVLVFLALISCFIAYSKLRSRKK